jgi:CBS domain-containing protein
MLTKVGEVLESKGRQVFSLPPRALVFDAVRVMAENSVGALLVIEGDRLVGIISERDYARKVVLKGRSSKETEVREIMSTPVQVVTPDCTVDEAMALMTSRRIRHLPVLEDERVLGVVSIGDLVRSKVEDQAATIEQLHAYITGQYPG